MSTPSERIVQIREKENMTAAEFSRLLGISHPTLLKWERGDALPNSSSLIKIYQTFRVRPDYVLLGIESDK